MISTILIMILTCYQHLIMKYIFVLSIIDTILDTYYDRTILFSTAVRRWRTSCLAVWKWRIASSRPRPYVSWGTVSAPVMAPVMVTGWRQWWTMGWTSLVGLTNCSNDNSMIIVIVVLIVSGLFGQLFCRTRSKTMKPQQRWQVAA